MWDWCGSPRPHPPQPQPVGSGPRPHAPRTGGRAWSSAQPRTPHTQARGAAPPGTLVPPHSAQSQLTRACPVELMTGLHAHTPRTHSQWVVGPGRTPQGPAVRRGRAPNRGPPTPRQETPPSPRAPSCRPHSAQSQLARARAVGLVTGSHAHTPRTHSQWIAGPGRTFQGRAVGCGRAPNPGRPTPRGEAPAPGRPRAAPTARRASSQKQACPQWGEQPQARQGDEGSGPVPQNAK